ncbi:MAG: hypothetical protein ACRELY_11335, partial [Polyangiaceae bacterium]
MRRERVTLIAALALASCAPQTAARVPTSTTTTTSAQVSENASSTPSPSPSTSTSTSTSTSSGGDQGLRAAGWVSLAIGASATVVAIATSGLMLHEQSVRSSDCNAQKVCSTDGINANNNLSANAPWNAGAWALAAVGTGVGVFLVLTNPPRSSPGQTTVG